VTAGVVADERALVVRGEHSDPHHVLGAHPADGGGVRIRAWRPGADAITALAPGGAVELTQTDPAGFFEGTMLDAQLPLRYQLAVRYPDGNQFVLDDPYRFLPQLGELDLHLAMEGRHEELYARLGANPRTVDGVAGTAFAVWAPAARAVAVVGDFNSWDGRLHPMRSLGAAGIWELFVPGAGPGTRYKFEIRTRNGEVRLKADPLAFEAERRPGTGSVVSVPAHRWRDAAWREARAQRNPWREPLSIYEVHLGSWRRTPEGGDLYSTTLGEQLAAHVRELGFTHVELLPVMAHPFTGSWGYQVTSYFAPDPRFGSPDDFRAFVDGLHGAGIGVILDWVPAHFPRDDWALARFDGTALYEHADPRRGAHPDWGTLVFNFGRNEVRNFLLASALYWTREQHADGLRVDAVASMIYRDYSRAAGEWVPNQYGGREDLEAVAFLRELNAVLHARVPGVISAAEESTSWPGVSRPTDVGGLGFGFKWNMGWMHDTLGYFGRDPIHRSHHHNELTFSLLYAFSENFILPLSHDEVVHGKGSLLARMPGDRWQRFANLRAMYGYMWAHPGKKLLFMGQEFAQEAEWSHDRSLDWHLLADRGHAGVMSLVRELNAAYRSLPALWQRDFDGGGFSWLEANDAASNVFAFVRRGDDDGISVVCVCNLSPIVRPRYRVGLPLGGAWAERINTDDRAFGGSGVGNRAVTAEPQPWHGQPQSAELTLPPLAVLWLVPLEHDT
jgi:1,4-alpha-glucan branching enzyme